MPDYGQASLRFIGIVDSSKDEESMIRIFPEFCLGLKDLYTFSHAVIIYWMHECDSEDERKILLVTPRRHGTDAQVGVFASRSPVRPNPLGFQPVEILRVRGCALTVRRLDAIKGTPIIDIKPYMPRGDSFPSARVPDWAQHGPKT